MTATLTVRLARPSRPAPTATAGRVPRIARLLAFAHKLEANIRSGVYDDLADAARKLALTRARITQLANLTLLAPAIQADILALPPITEGRDPVTERTLRPIVAESMWERQIELWKDVRKRYRVLLARAGREYFDKALPDLAAQLRPHADAVERPVTCNVWRNQE